VRVLLVKLADRLHNMRTLDHMSAEKRARISEETMDIYAPLAGRMGMQDMRDELEELSFRHINPEAHRTISKRLEELSERNADLVRDIEKELTELLAAKGQTTALVKGRQKKAYSVFRKMQSKSLSFEQLSDVYGFRVIVDQIPDCYKALGIVHTRWRVVPGRFKDYISNPKQNDYQSLHTTIVGPARQRIELQIRTRRMHDIAEYGIAAHTLYKDGTNIEANDSVTKQSNAYSWLRMTIESLAEGDNPEEFLEHTKLELFQDQVFCFTPKGKLIALPRGATPIDFAYAVHTNVGDTCVGAKINGRIMPLVTRLNNGDEVEIIRSGVQVPPAAWEEIVVTGKARSAIRRAPSSVREKCFRATS
jgi:guanosine-3',5'-bis(diphosphate) 3'-pyrophosphohydrolase